MGKMVRRMLHLEKPSIGEQLYYYEEETAVVDHEAMASAILPAYQEMFALCEECEKSHAPQPFFCENCAKKQK